MKTPMHAALFLGVLWAAWHLPRELVNAYDSTAEFLLSQTVFFLGYSDRHIEDDDLDDLTITDRTYFLKIGYAWMP